MNVLLLLILLAETSMTLNQALLSAVAALASLVLGLFAYLRVVDARQQKRIDECEEDRRDLWTAIIALGGKPHPRRNRGNG